MALQWQTIETVNQLSPAPPNVGTWIRTDRAQVIGGGWSEPSWSNGMWRK